MKTKDHECKYRQALRDIRASLFEAGCYLDPDRKIDAFDRKLVVATLKDVGLWPKEYEKPKDEGILEFRPRDPSSPSSPSS